MYYKVIGFNRRGVRVWLCNVIADSPEEAYRMACGIYGSLYVESVHALGNGSGKGD